MTQLMQLLQPLAQFPDSSIFSLDIDGDFWQLTSTAHEEDKFYLIEARTLRQKYEGMLSYQPELPEEALLAMATSARQAKVFVLIDTEAALDEYGAIQVNLRNPLVVNGATLHAIQVELGDAYPREKIIYEM